MTHRSRFMRLGAMLVAAALTGLVGAGPVAAKTEITWWHGNTGAIADRITELAKKFSERQGDYEVKPVYKGSYPEALAALIAAYRSKTQPHMALIFEVGTQTMIASGAVVPVFELMKEQGVSIEGADFIAPVKSYYSKDGQLYSMPFASSTAIFYYNKDAFKKAGLDPAKAPATFDEIEAAAKKIIASGAAKCAFSHAWPSWTMVEQMHAWHDQPFADQDNGFKGFATQLRVNGEFGVKVWDTLARWQKAGLYTYGGRTNKAEPMFTGGQCAMHVTSSAFMGAVMRDAKFEWGTGRLPRMAGYGQGNSIIGGTTIWIMKGHKPAEYKGMAQFLKFLGDDDQQAWWHQVTGYLPVSQSALRKLQADGWFQKHPNHLTAFDQISSGKTTAQSQGVRIGNYQAVRDALEAELESVIAGNKTAKQGLDDAVKKGNELLKEFAALYK
jgi:sn-glycerol 3-phosphate transport system substrate-binding protein